MAFNGTGTFVRLYNWVTDKANSVPITASRIDAEQDGIATGLSNCITKDGQTTITQNIPFNSKKITGLANGSDRTDSIALGQVQDGTYTDLGTTGGSADAYTASPSPAITAYATTQSFRVKIHADNTATDPYLQISSIADPATTAVIFKYDNAATEVALEPGDLLNGKIYYFDRNPGDTGWIVRNPEKIYLDATNILGATTVIAGKALIQDPIRFTFNTTDADHDIDFSAGNFNFFGGDGQAVASALTKKLDATWAAGTDAGGLSDALTVANNTDYYCFALSSADGATTDFGFDTSATATNLLADVEVIAAGLTKYSRIGEVVTDSSANIDDRYFRIVTPFGQIVRFEKGGLATGTTTIPLDDTIPQNTEGFEVLTVDITPLRADSMLKIDVLANLSTNSAQNSSMALFKGSDASAIAASTSGRDASEALFQQKITHYIPSGSTATVNYKVRVGNATGGTLSFNGRASSRLFGDVMASSITITEY